MSTAPATHSYATNPTLHFFDLHPDDEIDIFQELLHPVALEEVEPPPVDDVKDIYRSTLQTTSDASFEPSHEESSSSTIRPIDKKPKADKTKIITDLTAEQKKAIRKEKNRLSAQTSRERKRGKLEQLEAYQRAFFDLGLEIGPLLQQYQAHFPNATLDLVPDLDVLETCTLKDQRETFEKLQPIFAQVINTAIEYKATQEAESAYLQRRIQALQAENAHLKKLCDRN